MAGTIPNHLLLYLIGQLGTSFCRAEFWLNSIELLGNLLIVNSQEPLASVKFLVDAQFAEKHKHSFSSA